ncbi:MAG: hypothetical protein FJZ13_01515 [Candidatus Omnitrophica bacterium]|nr:hypothetical protein [Candidatus Omnitrophota bacterium]
MTEQEFWLFLERLWKNGRATQVTGVIDYTDFQTQLVGDYIRGHALLPKDYEKICTEDIIKMGNLLFKKEVKHKTKKAIIMLLAHQSSEIALTILAKYSLASDKDLEYFAKIALDECAMWNE